MQRLKDPNRVKAGKARQQQLRAHLGEDGYTAYQKACYADALAAYPDLHTRGAVAANAAQLAAWGVEGYIAQRKAAYRACCEKHGAAFARRVVQLAHEMRRLHRLEHPTPRRSRAAASARRTGLSGAVGTRALRLLHLVLRPARLATRPTRRARRRRRRTLLL